ncbi:AAR_G0019420.mRNA.1.CDS.1 [Saccharomyces cerevisiae]|nr:Srm1p [Saccharomyces cerevisiae YJM271]CAI4469929.1 AAR_G0019420.mRNA.1.CDS.1 [Saccharomyces cerevisiae]CAI6495028.1 CIC_HP1_G0017790.mRNA.1.CDS.1 [Saccharomyces cerevisiae]CAI6514813.1 ASB_HP1_G0019120.mRNA.1.CDS.1 [Saccharomyces cerevisiae]CAI6664417.1 AAR_G0019420.mRNA.1.CDS.1 [Saccharomyces cerevisiae]
MVKRTVATNGDASGPHRAKKMSKTHASHIINAQEDYKHMYLSVQPLDIFCWGTGSMCELGLGPLAKNKEVKRPRLNPFLPRDEAKIISFAVGGMHTLALDEESNVWSWGCNDVGALGRDTSNAKEQLKDMDADDSSDDEDGDLNELESTPAKIPRESFPPLAEGHKVVQLAATDNMSCALFSNGEVYAWGTFRCNEGILGFYQDKIKIQKTPWKVPTFSKYNIVQLAPGKDHILFLDEEGMVFAWGNGQQNQLGRKVMERFRLKTLDPRPFGLRHVKYIASGENHCFALTKDNKLVSWGLNQFGQCGVSEDVEDGALVTKPKRLALPDNVVIRSIAAGEHHSLILSQDGDLYSCGRLDMFEVGIPKDNLPEYTYKDVHGKARAVPLPTKLNNVPKFKSVAAGSHHSVAVAQNGIAYSWGFGETYAVGLGPFEDDTEVPTRIKNTATQDHNIILVGCGGQFSVSGGVKLSDEDAEKRADEMDD